MSLPVIWDVLQLMWQHCIVTLFRVRRTMLIPVKRAHVTYCLLFGLCCLLITKLDVFLAPFYIRYVISWTCHRCFVRPYPFTIQPLGVCRDKYGRHSNINALYLMPSRAEDTRRRALIRRTTLSFTNSNTPQSQSRHVFVVGGSPNETTQRTLEEESRIFGDVLQQEFVDVYDNLTLKTLSGLEWALHNCWNAKWLVKVDDDVIFKWEELEKLQKQLEHNHNDYVIGHCFYNMFPMRQTNLPDLEKIVINENIYPYRYFAPFCSGPIYMMSQNVAREILSVSDDTPYFKLEDAYLGLCLLNTNYTIHHMRNFLMTYKEGTHSDDICALTEAFVAVHRPGVVSANHIQCSHNEA